MKMIGRLAVVLLISRASLCMAQTPVAIGPTSEPVQGMPLSAHNSRVEAAFRGAANLRCENQASPIAVQSVHPRFSWEMHSTARGAIQSAYRLLVASSPELLAR